MSKKDLHASLRAAAKLTAEDGDEKDPATSSSSSPCSPSVPATSAVAVFDHHLDALLRATEGPDNICICVYLCMHVCLCLRVLSERPHQYNHELCEVRVLSVLGEVCVQKTRCA